MCSSDAAKFQDRPSQRRSSQAPSSPGAFATWAPGSSPLVPTQRTVEAGGVTTAPAALPAGVLALLAQAHECRWEAEQTTEPAESYVSAHIAAFRAATALVLLRSRNRTRSRPASVWALLTEVAPEFGEWSEYFAARTDRRAAADAGISNLTRAEAAELVARSGEFVSSAERILLEVLS